MDKREYVKDFYYKFDTDFEFTGKMGNAFGNKWPFFNFIKQLYGDPNDPNDLDDYHLDVIMHRGKLDYYPDEIIDQLYKVIKLTELNSKIKILAPICKALTRIYVSIWNAFHFIFLW